MMLHQLPLDMLCEIFIHLTIIERTKLCRISILFNQVKQNCRTVCLDFESVDAILKHKPTGFSSLMILTKSVLVKSFKCLEILQCSSQIALLMLIHNKKKNYFKFLHTLDIQNEKTNITCILNNIIGTKLQYTLKQLTVDKMEFFFDDQEKMDTFYHTISQLVNLQSLTFDYSCCKFQDENNTDRKMIGFFLAHHIERLKSEHEILYEKNASDYESDYFSDTSYSNDWDKFHLLFKRYRSYLSHIKKIKIKNIELDCIFYLILSLCLHPNLKDLDLQIVGNNSTFLDDELFSNYDYDPNNDFFHFSFYDVTDFIPSCLSLCSLSL
eukprot:235703_1